VIHVIPLGITLALWLALARVNRTLGWFRTGELVFWDAILLIATFLVWLRWF